VHRVALAYVVMAWIIVEGSAVVFPALLLPDWSHRLIVVLALIGFPVVIVLAWIFDITPAGVARTDAPGSEEHAAGAQAPAVQQPSGVPPAADSALASIAVMPFEALSAQPDDQFLARAISAEISSALSHLPEVRVAPSRSASSLDDATDLKSIGAKLEVGYVLTGSVRRRGDQLRVIAELGDAREGSVLWSEAYDRQPDDIMLVEEEIAGAIVGSFGGEQLREQIRRAADRTTSSTEAHTLVHKARAFVLNYGAESLAEAERCARNAIGVDPDYASAHAALASVLSEKVRSGLSENADADLAEALQAIDIAVERRSQDSFVLKLAGNVLSDNGHYDRAVSALRRAVEITPFDLGAWGYLASVLATGGKTDETGEAHAILDRIIGMAPQHPGQPYWMHHKAAAYTSEQQYEDAARFARQSVDRQPGLAWAWYLYANAAAMTGDNDAAGKAAENAAKANPDLSVSEYAAIVKRTSGSDSAATFRLAGLKKAGLLFSTRH